MKLSEKCDALQELARQCAGDAHKLFLLEALAEHAGEPEFTAEFVEWVKGLLGEDSE